MDAVLMIINNRALESLIQCITSEQWCSSGYGRLSAGTPVLLSPIWRPCSPMAPKGCFNIKFCLNRVHCSKNLTKMYVSNVQRVLLVLSQLSFITSYETALPCGVWLVGLIVTPLPLNMPRQKYPI